MNVKVGDTVVVRPHQSAFSSIRTPYYFAKVTKVGKLKISTDKGDFKTRNGSRFGYDDYGCDRIIEMSVTDAKKENEEISQDVKKYNIAIKLNDFNFKNLSFDVLQKIDNLIQEGNR